MGKELGRDAVREQSDSQRDVLVEPLTGGLWDQVGRDPRLDGQAHHEGQDELDDSGH